MTRRPLHHRTSSPCRRFWGVPSILLAIIALASPMAIGGVHALTASAMAALALAGLWWHLSTDVPPATDNGQTPALHLSIPALGFAAMALVCMLQLIPLPTALFRILQPTAHHWLAGTWEIAHQQPLPQGWHTLSVDPRNTTTQGLRWLAMAATAALAGQIITGRHLRRRWLGLLIITGAAIVLAGTLQHLSGTDKILGFYDAQISARSLSPFVSTNHAATYYGLIALVAIAYGLEHLRRSPGRASLGAAAATAGLLLCAAHGSDGALLAVVIGLGTLGVAAVTRLAPRQLATRDKWRLIAMGLLFAAAVTALFLPDDWTIADEADRLDETSAEVRVDMARAALRASAHYPLFGTGAGATERALPPYVDYYFQGPATIHTIENDPVEWAMTHGLPAALLMIALFALVVARTAPHTWQAQGRRGSAIACAVVLFMGVIAQFHFPSMVLGISLVAIIAVEACLHPHRDRLHRFASPRTMRLFVLALTLATAGLTLARIIIYPPGPEATLAVDADDHRVRQAIHRYPTDGVLLSAIALQTRHDGDAEHALTLAQRAFELRPHPQQQFLLASTLAMADRGDEAAQVYRDLFDDGPRRRAGYYRWAHPRLRFDLPTDELRALALADATTHDIRRFTRHLESEEGHLSAINFALALADARPHRADAHLQLITQYRRAGQEDLAELYARMLIAQNLAGPDGERPAGLAFLLDLLRRQNRLTEAQRIAHRAFRTGHTSPDLARQTLRLLPGSPDHMPPERLELFAAALDLGCTPPYDDQHRRLCWESHAFFAEAQGQLDTALGHLRRVDRHFQDPRPLGHFMVRQKMCRDLASLRRPHEGQRFERTLRRLERDCARR